MITIKGGPLLKFFLTKFCLLQLKILAHLPKIIV